MSFEPIINKDLLKDNVAYQYIESANFLDYTSILLEPFDELEQVFADILNKRMLETGTTDALDSYGVLVNQPREFYDSREVLFLGLDADDLNNPVLHTNLGDLNDPLEGGLLRSIEQPIAIVTDLVNDDYRTLIKGKAHRNNYKGGVESLISAINLVLEYDEPGSFHIEEIFTIPTDPYLKITFYVPISKLQKTFFQNFDVLPKPGGIRYEFIYN